MIASTPKLARQFTDAARAAAVTARRLKKDNALPKDASEVFAVRLPAIGRTFSWEIRRFGSLVLRRGDDRFGTAAEARVAGEAALATM